MTFDLNCDFVGVVDEIGPAERNPCPGPKLERLAVFSDFHEVASSVVYEKRVLYWLPALSTSLLVSSTHLVYSVDQLEVKNSRILFLLGVYAHIFDLKLFLFVVDSCHVYVLLVDYSPQFQGL